MLPELTASVRVRITAAATLVTAVALAVGGWALLRAVEDTQVSELRRIAERRLDAIAERLEAGQRVDASADLLGPPLGLVRMVDATTGNVLAAVDALPGGEGVMFQAALPAVGEQVEEGVVVGPAAIRLESISRTVDTPQGPVTVVAAAPADEISRSVAAVRRALFVGLPTLLAMVAAVAWVLTGRALRPVDHMRAEVEEISASTLHRRVPDPGSHDEVARLARTMNGMLDRIEAAATAQRQFVSDASHELRSPLATLRAQLEVAMRGAGPSELRTAVADALEEEERLEKLLDDLLALAAIDEGRGPAPFLADTATVDLVVTTEAEAARLRSSSLTVDVIASEPPPTVRCRPLDATRVVRNLLDNAARHAASSVRASVLRDGAAGLTIAVEDDGPGIPPADRERVFERFTRLDEGRARSAGGAGLGLALVKSIVERCNGTVRIDDSELGGARIVITLPE